VKTAIQLSIDLDEESFKLLLHHGLGERFPDLEQKLGDQRQKIQQNTEAQWKEMEAELQSQIPLLRGAVARLGFPYVYRLYP
jgi:hypothetical protein